MSFSDNDIRMMRRALQLARAGAGHVSPNPMVGAVITAPDGRIIGEGWHRRFGGPHAEVNAVRSVAEADKVLLSGSTIYVTLEPCSHYGKTPPCAKLLVETGFRRVVVACGDPNPKVAGRGIAMLREAGIEVEEGLLEDEARELNKTFMTAQTLRRPFVTLKWACSADGYMDCCRCDGEHAYCFSTPITGQIVHRRRAMADGIAVGARTVLADSPRLDVRCVAGNNPRPVVFDRHGLLDGLSSPLLDRAIRVGDEPLADALRRLYAADGISSILVEGGPSLLNSFISAGLWDEAYVEVAPVNLADRGRAEAPVLTAEPVSAKAAGSNMIYTYSNRRAR